MKINNGIVTSNKINITQHLIPRSNVNAWGYPMEAEYITVHNTGNPNISALSNSLYIDKNNGYVSWHFTVGKDEAYQELPINISAWHAGDGVNGIGNRKSIGIEIAEVDGAEETAIKFIAELMKVTSIPIANIVPHKRWSGKNCPRLILPHWTTFISNIEKELSKEQNMTLEEAKKVVRAKAGLDNNTMNYLEYYRHGESLLLKLAKAIQK